MGSGFPPTGATDSCELPVNKYEVNCLITLFYNLVGEVAERPGVVIGLDRNAFRNILHVTFGMTDDMIMDRVFRGFDRDNDGCVSVSEWIHGLSLFLRGTLEEKMKYCFEVFDLNGDGFISKEEMFHMLKNSLLKQPSEEDPDEGIKDLVEITLKKMDQDHDGKLSFTDYEKAVREETLLLEAFGPCLPDPKLTVNTPQAHLTCFTAGFPGVGLEVNRCTEIMCGPVALTELLLL
ncbi:EF-hand calcium-binding domain-containing protein 1 [Microtus ochrogaster]|uniref:EF-hand calcium-binding domain-containing protein 1 n=1 Tax=Microtus ochrogaster TaxID=79684 RepID=A0A8J6GCQ2_MICOH|nr:EF-hand calcium-binding domain-containing protein 1 [Microtus ochrogaster]